MSDFLIRAGEFVWGPGTILLIVGTGIWFTVGTRFLQLRRLPQIVRCTVGSLFKRQGVSKKGGITPFQAVSTALAGTMGTGNIAGIATAIVAGGPGAIFWMWVSAFFGMMTKYAEVVLAVRYRRREPNGSFSGGPMAYIEDGLGKPLLSSFFSICCVLASFGIGNATQVHSAAAALYGSFGIHPTTTGVVAAILTALVIMGGIGRIGKVAESAIPLVSLFYLAGGGLVLWMNRAAIP
ncbi:MAG: alanine:cation symporter family protein, partial [Angelakisella sp.]